MTSIDQIPYKDIQNFILKNKNKVYELFPDIILFDNEKETYDIVYELLKDKKAVGHPISIIEWLMAHNLIINN